MFIVYSRYSTVRQHLDVKADPHVAIEAPQPFNAQEIVAVPVDRLPLLPWDPRQRPGVEGLPAVLCAVQTGGASRQSGNQAQYQDSPQGCQSDHSWSS